MKSKFLVYGSLLTLLVMFCAFTCVDAQSTGNGLIKPAKFERLMKKENTVVIDVRTVEEYNDSHLPGALNMNVNSEEFAEKIKGLDKSKKYLLYCRSGKRSQKALDMMAAQGFEQVHHLKGGILKWKGKLE